MKTKHLWFILIMMAGMCMSCMKLPVYSVIDESSFTEQTNFAGYDKDAQLAWLISQDEYNLYLRIETESQISKAKMLKAGFYIYLSSTGKKSKEQFLHFPIKKSGKIEATDETKEELLKNKGRRVSTEEMIKQLEPSARWVVEDSNYIFHYVVDTSEFKLSLQEDSNTLMRYTARIPYDRINWTSDKSDGLVIGLISGAFDIPAGSRPMPTSQPNTMSPGGRLPNQPQNTGTNFQRGSFSELADPIKIWFKIENINGLEHK